MEIEKQLNKCRSIGLVPIKQLDNKKYTVDSFIVDEQEISVALKSLSGASVSLVFTHDNIGKFIQNFEDIHPTSANNMKFIREILFESLHQLQNGMIDLKHAKTIACTAQVLINTVKIEMDYKRLGMDKDNEIKMLEQ